MFLLYFTVKVYTSLERRNERNQNAHYKLFSLIYQCAKYNLILFELSIEKFFDFTRPYRVTSAFLKVALSFLLTI